MTVFAQPKRSHCQFLRFFYIISLMLLITELLANVRSRCCRSFHSRYIISHTQNGRSGRFWHCLTTRLEGIHLMLTIGVVAIQGAVSEHITALEKSSKDLDCKIVTIKRAGLRHLCCAE